MVERFIKERLFSSTMSLEKEMEMYGAFKESPLGNGPETRKIGGNIDALVTATGPCGCMYGSRPEQKQYKIPQATENPAVHRGMLRRWIQNFHEMNGMSLPKGFYQRDKRQLQGMFHGMRKQYKISIEDITGKQY